jgi:hypothetical protein
MKFLKTASIALVTSLALLGFAPTSGPKESFTLNGRDQRVYTFFMENTSERVPKTGDTLILRFSFSLLAPGDIEELNNNKVIFKMKYTKTNALLAFNNLPDNIISKLGVNRPGRFPATYEPFCRDKIGRYLSTVFRMVESDIKLKKVGEFE